ncbi:MAG: uroporphyrinogen decarboxylase [Acidobacteriota bacterium]
MISEAAANERFLRACRREPTDATPVWFMRQAGRYMPEYRALRERYSLLEICRQPELVAEVTLQPLAVMDLDAAIIFADIMLPLDGLGVHYDIVEGTGPVVFEPIRQLQQVESLHAFEAAGAVPYLLEGIRQVKDALAGRVPLIGFGAGPFTLASYLVEGKGSRTLQQTKALIFSEPKTWHKLMRSLSTALADYLTAQVAAGAEAIQIFDSWVGALAPDDYDVHVAPYSRRLFAALEECGVPTIHFGTGTATLLRQMAAAGGDVIGVDWRLPLDAAWEQIGSDRGIQGNLDPAVLLADFDTVWAHATHILELAGGRPGHIFNLGHGILPGTPVDNVRRLVDFVHEFTSQARQQPR